MLSTMEGREAGMDLGEEVRRHRPALVSFAWRMLRDRHEAEDAVQSGLARAVHALREGVRPDNARAWLYKIVLREAQHILEKRRVRAGRAAGPRPEGAGPAGPEAGMQEEKIRLQQAVLEEVARLPDPQRQVLLLRYCQHLELEEVAGILEMPVGTVKSHQSRGLRAVQERMGPRLEEWA